MTDLAPDPATESRLHDYLTDELRRAETDYPHRATEQRLRRRGVGPVGLGLAIVAVFALATVLVAPGMLRSVTPGPAAIPLGQDGLPLSIDGEPVRRLGDLAARPAATGELVGGTLVLATVCYPKPGDVQLASCDDWRLVAGPAVEPASGVPLEGAPAAPGFVRTSGALTVVRVGEVPPGEAALPVEAVAWRQPTKGAIPDAATPPEGGFANEALVPDFVGVWSRNGLTTAGYMPKRYALGGGELTPGTPSNPPQALPTPVYGEDLTTLVGHLVPGVGFVGLGATETPVPVAVSVAPSSAPAPSLSAASSTEPVPTSSPVIDCGRISSQACFRAIGLARAVDNGETRGATRIVVDDGCSPAVVCDRYFSFDSLVVFVTAGTDPTGWIAFQVTGLEDDAPTAASRYLGDLPAHIVARLVAGN
jgi:hypothetical protein